MGERYSLSLAAETVIGGRYRVVRPLGKGGMASVFLAAHIGGGRDVALKVLSSQGSVEEHAQRTQLFEREFLMLAQVSHPRIVAAYDYGVDAELGAFYAMELLDGGDLSQRAPVPYRDACSIGRDVCSALALLHARRLLYRDLSPRNVRCTVSGQAKLIDFGALTPMGTPKEVVGTPPFVAPEVLQDRPLDCRTDLYALGATLYFALTGYQAYPARSMVQLWELWRTQPPMPSAYVPEIPEAVDRLVMELIQLDPAHRPANAADVMQRLEAIAGLPPDEQLVVQQSHLVAPTLVGRDTDLSAARESLAAALRGRASSVLVIGPSGIGRSRFLDECALQAKLQGAVTLSVAPNEADSHEYGLLRVLVATLLEAAPDSALDLTVSHREVLAHVLPALRQRWPSLTLAPLSDHERHGRVLAAASAWIAAIAKKRPLCLVVDDAGRADAPSAALLNSLIRDQADAPLFLVWTVTRDERAAAEWPLALTLLERSSKVLKLSALTSAETAALLSTVFGDVPNLAQLADYVDRTAAGNPRDSLQLLEHLATEGVIHHAAGAWSLPSRLVSAELPSSVTQALEQRIVRLGRGARWLGLALSLEPRQLFSADECAVLLDGVDGANPVSDLLEAVAAGVLLNAGTGYRLPQLALAAAFTNVTSDAERAAGHLALARVFARRGDGLRSAQHLIHAGDHERGLDLLIQASSESQRRTDADMRVYFEEMRALPVDWLSLYQEALTLCEQLGRPPRDSDALLGRLAGFAVIANTAHGVDGVALLKRRLDFLARQVGLDIHDSLPASLDLGTRLKQTLARAQERFDATAAEERVFSPVEAIRPLTTTLLASLGLISFTNDVRAHRALPKLGPLVALSPALWVVQQTFDGLGARIEGRLEQAAEIYRALLARMEQPDRAGLGVSEHRSAMLRIHLSLGTLEACMGRATEAHRAELVGADPDYETQGLMLRELFELWQGRVAEAERTKEVVEQRRAFGGTHNNFEGQYLLAEIGAQVMLEDLTGLRRATEAAKRIALRHKKWNVVVSYCQGEYDRIRGDLPSALNWLERALDMIGGAGEHQIWANAAAAQVRVLAELGRHDDACRLGELYLQQAEQHGLGYLAHYVALALSQAHAGRGDVEAAIQRVDAVLDGFQQLGARGLNPAVALEQRALLALRAQDQQGFEHYVALCSAESERVARRLQRSRRGLGRAGRPEGDPALASVLVSELAAVMSSELDLGERTRRVLAIMSHNTNARGAVFYALFGSELRRVTTVGDVVHPEQLERWAQAYFEGQVFAQHASTSQLDEVGKVEASQYGIPEGMYHPTLVGHDSPEGYVYRGLLVLVMPIAPDLSWMTMFSAAWSRALEGASAKA